MDDVSLLTNTYSPIELRKSVLSRVIDIAFLFEPPFVEDLITEKVASVPLHLVTTEPHDLDNLTSLENFIMVDYGDALNAQYRRDFQDMTPAKHYMSQPRIALNFLLDAGEVHIYQGKWHLNILKKISCLLLKRRQCIHEKFLRLI